MCLIVKSGPHVSTRNITVYKIIQLYWLNKADDNLIGFSAIMGYSYYKNSIYTTNFKKHEEKQKEIYEGFHSYKSKKEANYRLYTEANHIIVKMTIPAYTKYYKGKDGDIVSEVIITGTPK